MKIFVTGATGFVGSNLVKRLVENGDDITIIVRKNSKVDTLNGNLDKIKIFRYDGDITELNNLFAASKPELVFHVASLFLSQHQPKDIRNLIQSNLTFGIEVVDCMVKNNCYKLINTGTSWQHYKNETYNPVCLYAATKEAFEKLLKYYLETSALKIITLKLFDTFGPNDQRAKLVSLLKKNAENGTVLDMSPGEQEIDMVHISDVVEAFLVSMKLLDDNGLKNRVYGISSENVMTLKQFVDVFNRNRKLKVNVSWGTRPYREREVITTWKKYEKLPGWKCKKYTEDQDFFN